MDENRTERGVTLAIHGAGGFSSRWIEECERKGISHRIVDCRATDIIQQVRGHRALLWHWSHHSPEDTLIARHVIHACEETGMVTFPDSMTCWHFDDKLSQKYLLEAVDAPLVPTHVFLALDTALEWIDGCELPIVFKLRRGAGSANVRLVRTRREARSIANKAFGSGFQPVASYTSDLKVRIARARARPLWSTLMRIPGGLMNVRALNRNLGVERGYVYFQEFMPDNLFDTRVTVIGERAFAFTRDVRPRDFRASGSGRIDYDVERIDMRSIAIAFHVCRQIRAQSMAFDFVRDREGRPRIVEMSYGYQAQAVQQCPGHWSHNLDWVPGQMWPQDAILEDVLARASAG